MWRVTGVECCVASDWSGVLCGGVGLVVMHVFTCLQFFVVPTLSTTQAAHLVWKNVLYSIMEMSLPDSVHQVSTWSCPPHSSTYTVLLTDTHNNTIVRACYILISTSCPAPECHLMLLCTCVL